MFSASGDDRVDTARPPSRCWSCPQHHDRSTAHPSRQPTREITRCTRIQYCMAFILSCSLGILCGHTLHYQAAVTPFYAPHGRSLRPSCGSLACEAAFASLSFSPPESRPRSRLITPWKQEDSDRRPAPIAASGGPQKQCHRPPALRMGREKMAGGMCCVFAFRGRSCCCCCWWCFRSAIATAVVAVIDVSTPQTGFPISRIGGGK